MPDDALGLLIFLAALFVAIALFCVVGYFTDPTRGKGDQGPR